MSSITAPQPPIPAVPASAGGAVQSVDRALRILQSFAAPEQRQSVGDLARMLEVHKSTASRLALTLVAAGFLERSAAGEQLRLGPEIARLGRLAAHGRSLQDLARRAMDELGAETGETVTLSVGQDATGMTIAQTDSRFVVGTQSWVGRRSPLHATSDGKVLLAFGAAAVPDGPLEPRTPQTVTDRERLARELAQIRRRGWATAVGDFEVGLNGVAAPIFDADGGCCAALCVSGPAYRLAREDLPALAERCRAAASRVGIVPAAGDPGTGA